MYVLVYDCHAAPGCQTLPYLSLWITCEGLTGRCR